LRYLARPRKCSLLDRADKSTIYRDLLQFIDNSGVFQNMSLNTTNFPGYVT